MTRKSRREIQRAVDELGGRKEEVTLSEIYRYFDHVAEDPDTAAPPRDVFADSVVDGFPNVRLPFEELPGDLSPDVFTSVERFALAFLDGDRKRGVIQMRLSQTGGEA